MKEMTEAQQKAKALLYEPAYASDKDAATRQAAAAFGEGYKDFLTRCKTEREVAAYAEEALKAAGYQLYDDRKQYAPGEKIYWIHQGKVVLCGTIGTRSMEDGFHLVIAHIDAPRLDIRPNPLYEAAHFSLLKTHYYGGIRKYQWATMPLAIHGVFTRADGTTVTVQVGEDVGDPAFCITDLLPHLSAEQNKRELSDGIRGEELNILIGSEAVEDEEVKEKIKLTVLSLLHEKYGMNEEDFLSAELSAVPAFPARDLGFDRALIGAYGHDDRVCAYPALTALLEGESAHTVMALLVDKEEIGSEGTTGMQCAVYADLMEEIALAFGANFRKVRARSKCLSSDVTAAFDPNFAGVYEKMNAAMLSCGTCMNKFTGSGGKSGSNDASAEFIGEVRRMFAEGGVVWQTAELGKVDAGGGGTVAKYLSKLNIDTVDLGVPVLSMHAPYEVISKADLYSNYKAFLAFMK